MEWLLILSALLNAATGAFTGTRGPEATASHEVAVEAVAAAESLTAVVAPAAAHEVAAPDPGRARTWYWAVAEAPAEPAPLETDRLIE